MTVMDPNTRSLVRVQITDIINDSKIFQILRGGTVQDALDRKQMVFDFKADKSLIDT